MSDNLEHAKGNAAGWLASIEEMLEALKGHEEAAKAAGWTGPFKDQFGAVFFKNEDDGMTWACTTWKQLCDDFDIDPEPSDEAHDSIRESVLSVLIRNGWHEPGNTDDDGPDEYEILLTTGGPALRIWGKLDKHCQPENAELQMQDWGTPWTRYPAAEATLLEFAQHFYFGE